MNKINYNSLKKVLSLKDMKNILGGSGGNESSECCCWFKCADPWFEGMCDLSQNACWDMMERDCAGSFTIQPC